MCKRIDSQYTFSWLNKYCCGNEVTLVNSREIRKADKLDQAAPHKRHIQSQKQPSLPQRLAVCNQDGCERGAVFWKGVGYEET